MILVAGGTGFLGSHIVSALTSLGEQVAVLTRTPSSVASNPALDGVDAVEGDVTDAASLGSALEGCSTVVMAAQFRGHPVERQRKELTYDEVDRAGTENLLAAATVAGVRRFVYISGAGVGQERPEEWFVAKERAEEATRASGLTYLIVRPSWAYGPEDKALNRIARISKWSPVVPVLGWKRQRVMPVAADDLANLVAAAVDSGDEKWNATYEIGGPDVMSMREVVQTLLAVTGRKRLMLPVPNWLMKLASIPLLVLPTPPLSPRAVDFATGDALVDNGPASRVFGIAPRSLADGLRDYL